MASHAAKLSPRTLALAALIVLALVVAGCGGTSYGSGSSSKPATPSSTSAPASSSQAPASSAGTSGIPQNNGGDHDGDNNGGPSDGDGNV